MAFKMLFIHPMWDHESQRIGKQKCTPIGYGLHVAADMLGFVGLLLLLVGVPLYLAYRKIVGTFENRLFWLLALPFVVAVIGRVLFEFSWWLAWRKGFQYDSERCEASWNEAGERVTFHY